MEEELLKIIEHFGVNIQQRKLAEEAFELNEAIFQYEEQKRVCEEFCSRLHCDKEREHIAEEIADVCVILRQFMEFYNITQDEISERMANKIKRTFERIESGYYEKPDNC